MIPLEKKSTALIGMLAAACSADLMAGYGEFYSELNYSDANRCHAELLEGRLFTETSLSNPVSNDNSLVSKILSYLKLEHDWDGYDGVPPEKQAVISAINFVELLKKENFIQPKAMLSGDGEVGLYWDANGIFIDVGFEESGLMSFYAKTSTSEVFGGDELSPSAVPSELMHVLDMLSSLSSVKSTIPDSFFGSYLECA
jgi:hypothetical protein